MSVRTAFREFRKSTRAVALTKILAAGCIAGSFTCGALRAADKPDKTDKTPDPVTQAVQTVFKNTRDCVVKIEGTDPHDLSTLVGTGFFVDADGTIYTCYRMGGEMQGLVVSFGDKKYPAKLLIGDPRSGIAILKIDAQTPFPFLHVGKTDDLAVNTPILVVGYPLNLPLTPSLGLVAGVDSGNAGGTFITKHIRADIALKPGQPGAPMLNLKGEVVGMVVSEGGETGTPCYALPMEAAQKVRSDFNRFGEIHHGWIGILVAESKAKTAAGSSSVVVSSLMAETPAAESGLMPGDIILQIGTKKIIVPADVVDASFFVTAGDEIPVLIQRGNEKITLKVQAAAEKQPEINARKSDSSKDAFPVNVRF